MSDPGVPRPLPAPSACWTRERLDLLTWMRRTAPSLADLYQAAVLMVDDPAFPGRLRLVSHAVREIRNRLPDVVVGSTTVGRVQYENAMDNIARRWQAAGFARDGSLPDAFHLEEVERPRTVRVKVPLRLFREIAGLVDEHLNARARPRTTASRLFDGLAPESRGATAELQPVLELWVATTEWFMKQTHDSAREAASTDVQALPEYFARFEATLFSLTREYFRGEEVLDAILLDANT